MSMSPMGNPVTLRQHLHTQVDEGRTIQQLIPFILHLPVKDVQDFINDHIASFDGPELKHYGWKVVSILEILPPDIIRHALTFVADCQSQIKSKSNIKLLQVNRAFRKVFREAFYQQRVAFHKFIGDLTTVAQDRIEYAAFLIQDYRFEEARRQYELCTSQSPTFAPGWKSHAEYIRTYGGSEGEIQAIEILQNALTYHHNNADLHEEISTMYCGIGKFSDALYHFGELLQLKPGRADIVLKMARIQAENPTDAEAIQTATRMFEQAFQNQSVKFLPHDFISFSDHLIQNCNNVARAAYVLQAAILRFEKDPDRDGNVHLDKINLMTGENEPRVAMEPEAARLLLHTALVLRDPVLREKDESGHMQYARDAVADAVLTLQRCIDIHECGDCAVCMERMQCEVHAEAFRHLAGLLTFDVREYRFFYCSLDYFVRAMELAPTDELRQAILIDYRQYVQILMEVGEQLESEAELWLLNACENDDELNFVDWKEDGDDEKGNDEIQITITPGSERTVEETVEDSSVSVSKPKGDFARQNVVVESFDEHGDIYD